MSGWQTVTNVSILPCIKKRCELNRHQQPFKMLKLQYAYLHDRDAKSWRRTKITACDQNHGNHDGDREYVIILQPYSLYKRFCADEGRLSEV